MLVVTIQMFQTCKTLLDLFTPSCSNAWCEHHYPGHQDSLACPSPISARRFTVGLKILGADRRSDEWPFFWSPNLHNPSLGLWGIGLPLQCWSVAPQPLLRMLLETHLSAGLFQGNESSVQKWQSPSKQEGKYSSVFPLLLSSLQCYRLIEAFSKDNFYCSQPSFPFPIRNRSVLLWLNSLNSPRGDMWNKRINYFKTKIQSSLGIKLESENEKQRRSLAALRCFTEFSPW